MRALSSGFASVDGGVLRASAFVNARDLMSVRTPGSRVVSHGRYRANSHRNVYGKVPWKEHPRDTVGIILGAHRCPWELAGSQTSIQTQPAGSHGHPWRIAVWPFNNLP